MPNPPSPAVEELTTAVSRAFGGLPASLNADRLHALGFTPEDFTGMTALAKHALTVEALVLGPHTLAMPAHLRTTHARNVLTFLLLDLARTTGNRQAALTWVTVIASVGTDAAARHHASQMKHQDPIGPVKAAVWTRLVGPLAPYAWAAGHPLALAVVYRLAAVRGRGYRESELVTQAWLGHVRLPGLATLDDIAARYPNG